MRQQNTFVTFFFTAIMLLPFYNCSAQTILTENKRFLPFVLCVYETTVDVTQFYRIYLENYSNIFDH